MAASGCQVLPGSHPVLPGDDQVLPGMTRCDQAKCFGETGVAKKVFWRDGSARNSVLA